MSMDASGCQWMRSEPRTTESSLVIFDRSLFHYFLRTVIVSTKSVLYILNTVLLFKQLIQP